MSSINLTRERSLYTTFSERAIALRQREMARIQEQLGTGKSINRASDDPGAYGQARRLEVLGERYSQYQRTVDSSRAWVDQSQSALNELSEIFTHAVERGMQASNQTHDAGDFEIQAKALEALLGQAVDALNSKSGDEYVFAGSRSAVQPFTKDAANVVTYGGNKAARTRQIGEGMSLKVNVTGSYVNDTGGGDTAMGSLKDLIDAVRSGDRAGMQTALGRVERSRDHFIDTAAEAGATANRLSIAEDQLADATIAVEGQRADLEYADYAELATRFQREQTGLQAALRATAAITQTSIMDYLR